MRRPSRRRAGGRDRARAGHADRGADRIRQDARGVPRVPRSPAARGARRGAARHDARPLRVAAQARWRTTSSATSRSRSRSFSRSPSTSASACRRSASRSAPATRPPSERQKMLRKPPHILVTTPESLYIVLTGEKSREIAARRRHGDRRRDPRARARQARRAPRAVARAARRAVPTERPVRIGLSATQRPIEQIARFLVGQRRSAGRRHRRRRPPPRARSRDRDRRPRAGRGRARTSSGPRSTTGSRRSCTSIAARWCSSTPGGWRSGSRCQLEQRLGEERGGVAPRQPVAQAAARAGAAAQARHS